jgi:hypothetical protein
MCSSNSDAAGEIRVAKSANDNFDFAMLSRTEWLPASSDRFTSDGNGNELNSETKLTQTSYQSGGQSRGGCGVEQASRLLFRASRPKPLFEARFFDP